ncbi:MAG: hypothetical protein JJ863_24635 [Deltaproteobacteria bacterium]|nr:hypothetical protein [Deltaproteobacteria bacterium]
MTGRFAVLGFRLGRWRFAALIAWLVLPSQSLRAQERGEPRPLAELCETIRVDSGGTEDGGIGCEVSLRAGGFAAVTVHTGDGDGTTETRLLVTRAIGGTHRVLRLADVDIDSGGHYPSSARWLRSRALGRGVFLFELEVGQGFYYPHSPTDNESRRRAVVLCERGPERCSRPISIAAWGATTASGYPWSTLSDDWWTRRLEPGEGDFVATASVSVPRHGVARLRLRAGLWGNLRSGRERWIDPPRGAMGRTRDIRFGPREPTPPMPTLGRIATVEGTRRVEYSFTERGQFPAICSQFATGELRCALQELSEQRLALLVRSRDRVMAFLAKREEGELRLLTRLIDRQVSAQEGLGVIRSWQAARLSPRFDGYTFDDVAPSERHRYLVVCERSTGRCVARAPLRMEIEERDEPASTEPWALVAEAAADVRGDVLSIRRISGAWSELLEVADEPLYDGDETGRPPEHVDEIRVELPPREPPTPPW